MVLRIVGPFCSKWLVIFAQIYGCFGRKIKLATPAWCRLRFFLSVLIVESMLVEVFLRHANVESLVSSDLSSAKSVANKSVKTFSISDLLKDFELRLAFK